MHAHSRAKRLNSMSNQESFFLQYQYNIKQTSNEIMEKYQLGYHKLI